LSRELSFAATVPTFASRTSVLLFTCQSALGERLLYQAKRLGICT
jgi:hypothetical protein